jgi:hypothetical protein
LFHWGVSLVGVHFLDCLAGDLPQRFGSLVGEQALTIAGGVLGTGQRLGLFCAE